MDRIYLLTLHYAPPALPGGEGARSSFVFFDRHNAFEQVRFMQQLKSWGTMTFDHLSLKSTPA